MWLRNEIAKRYTFRDWLKSRQVAKVMDIENSDQIILSALNSNNPTMIGRLGGTEARFIGEFLKMQRKHQVTGLPFSILEKTQPRWRKRKWEIWNNAGFFPSDWKAITEFVSIYTDALRNIDVLGAWGVAYAWPEGIAVENMQHPRVTLIDYTAPWIRSRGSATYASGEMDNHSPWSSWLQDKRVLVISGFSDSIEKQFMKRDKLFPGYQYPNFELKTIQAPLLMGEVELGGKSWFEHLDSLTHSMTEMNFDVALVSCGALSLPLVHHAKRLGKVGIHCGGALQLFFGLMGNRWNSDPEVLNFVNEHWTRPSKAETPSNASRIEGACYW